jgi:hypothetical protein
MNTRSLLVAGALVLASVAPAHAGSPANGCATSAQARGDAIVAAVGGDGVAAAALECGGAVPPPVILDTILCPIFQVLQGTYEISTPFATIVIMYIAPDGDVYLAGEYFWDCPPY